MDMMRNNLVIKQAGSKKELIEQLNHAVALAREIERQAKRIAKIVQEHHRIPLAA